MPTLIRRCLQALAESLKENNSITNIDLFDNKIGTEGAKACVWSGLRRMLRHVMMSCPSGDSDKLGWFGGHVVGTHCRDGLVIF